MILIGLDGGQSPTAGRSAAPETDECLRGSCPAVVCLGEVYVPLAICFTQGTQGIAQSSRPRAEFRITKTRDRLSWERRGRLRNSRRQGDTTSSSLHAEVNWVQQRAIVGLGSLRRPSWKRTERRAVARRDFHRVCGTKRGSFLVEDLFERGRQLSALLSCRRAAFPIRSVAGIREAGIKFWDEGQTMPCVPCVKQIAGDTPLPQAHLGWTERSWTSIPNAEQYWMSPRLGR